MGGNILLAMMVASVLVAATESALAFIAPHRVAARKVQERWNNLLMTLSLMLVAAAFLWQEIRGGDLNFVLVNMATLMMIGCLATGWIMRRRTRADNDTV